MSIVRLKKIVSELDCIKVLKDFSNCLESLQHSSPSELDAFARKFIEKGNFVIAQNDAKENMGFIAYYANDVIGGLSFISMIAVHSQYRQMHIGSALIDYCISDSIARGMKSLKLEVSINNLIARAFYRKKDFFEVGDATSSSLFLEKKLL